MWKFICTVALVLVVGVALITASGCGKKSVQSGGEAQSSQQGPAAKGGTSESERSGVDSTRTRPRSVWLADQSWRKPILPPAPAGSWRICAQSKSLQRLPDCAMCFLVTIAGPSLKKAGRRWSAMPSGSRRTRPQASKSKGIVTSGARRHTISCSVKSARSPFGTISWNSESTPLGFRSCPMAKNGPSATNMGNPAISRIGGAISS